MEADALGYTVALGLPALRARIARLYREWYGVELDPARVVVTPGSSGAFLLAFTALFDAGDRVALGAPGYPSYRQILKALDLEPVGVQTARREPPAAGARRSRPHRLAGPHRRLARQPDGHDAGPRRAGGADRRRAGARGAAFISDEIYHGIEYERRAVSALEISDDVYVINSFSKYFSMTGWRVGWMVVPPRPCPAGRAAGAEPVHLRAACQPGRRAGRDGCERGTGGQHRRLCREPRA